MASISHTLEVLTSELHAHAEALAGQDPAALERSNAALARIVSEVRAYLVYNPTADLRQRLAGIDAAALERVRSQLNTQQGLIARASAVNRAGLTALGLADQDRAEPSGAPPAPARRATHLVA